ncbi:MAG: hypothetical protein RUMPE_01215 [Eubacteriales bacterium SKADARSKE-1]|nr:hypothetical protein [Eubacteriales bacterium SKADARSKE-1]
MIVLYILLIIIFIKCILIFCPISFDISFEDTFSMRCKFLFISFSVYPQKEKKKIRKNLQKNYNKNNKVRDIIKEKGLNGFLKLVKKLVSISISVVKSLFKHLYIDNLDLNVMVAEEDAAATATRYGQVCSIVYPALNILLKNNYKQSYSVIIYPSFTEHKSKVTLKMKAHIKLIYILICAVKAFFKFIKDSI